MRAIRPSQHLAGLLAVALVGAVTAIAAAANASGSVALAAIILAAIPGGWLIVRSVEDH